MSRWLLLSLLLVPLAASGCSMCCGPYDYEYPVFQNGKYVRTDPEYGRVGSIFSDPNAHQGTSPFLTNQDVPQDDLPKGPDDDEGLDDPEFNRNNGSDTDSGSGVDGDEQNDNTDDVDTSARVPRRNFYNRSWR